MWLGAEAIKGGLVADGWRGWVGFTGVAFGVCGWEWVVVGVDGWLLAGWWWLVLVVSAAMSRGGGGGVGVGRWWRVWGTWRSMVLDG